MGILRTVRLASLLVAALVAGGCAWLMRDGETRFENTPPNQLENRNLTERRCTPCHELDRVLNSLWMVDNKRDLEVLVDDMADREGAAISTAEKPKIVSFLDYYRFHAKNSSK